MNKHNTIKETQKTAILTKSQKIYKSLLASKQQANIMTVRIIVNYHLYYNVLKPFNIS